MRKTGQQEREGACSFLPASCPLSVPLAVTLHSTVAAVPVSRCFWQPQKWPLSTATATATASSHSALMERHETGKNYDQDSAPPCKAPALRPTPFLVSPTHPGTPAASWGSHAVSPQCLVFPLLHSPSSHLLIDVGKVTAAFLAGPGLIELLAPRVGPTWSQEWGKPSRSIMLDCRANAHRRGQLCWVAKQAPAGFCVRHTHLLSTLCAAEVT